MDVEGVLLTGGESLRMGKDKASIEIGGVPLAKRVAAELAPQVTKLTVLGQEPLGDEYLFLKDHHEADGPLAALAEFHPNQPFTFVASCDLPAFDGRIVPFLREKIGTYDAVVPFVNDRPQPFSSIYSYAAMNILRAPSIQKTKKLRAWLEELHIVQVSEEEIKEAGFDPKSLLGINTPKQLEEFLEGYGK